MKYLSYFLFLSISASIQDEFQFLSNYEYKIETYKNEKIIEEKTIVKNIKSLEDQYFKEDTIRSRKAAPNRNQFIRKR